MGIVLPKEALAKLKTGKGETLYLINSSEEGSWGQVKLISFIRINLENLSQ